MSSNAFLTLKGKKQGQIKGSVTQKGREGSIAVYSYNLEIISPRDAASGLPTGKRQHRPIHITKEIDKSTPLLFSVLVNNESLTEVIIKFFAPIATGTEKQIYTVKLTNANIASFTQNMELNKTDPGSKLPVLEEISFTYEKIEITWEDGVITASDNWQI